MRTLTHPDPSALEPCITKDVIKSSSRTQTARMMMMPVELAPHSFTTRCGDEFLLLLPQTDRGAAFPILLVSWSLYGKSLKKRQRQSKSRRFRQVLNADKTVRLTFGPHPLQLWIPWNRRPAVRITHSAIMHPVGNGKSDFHQHPQEVSLDLQTNTDHHHIGCRCWLADWLRLLLSLI